MKTNTEDNCQLQRPPYPLHDAGFSGKRFPADLCPFIAKKLLLGGGLEDGGWRGYLLPCFSRKCPILLSSTAVSLLWVLWHLPYFLLPGNLQSEQNFFSYTLIGVVTSFILTAIYLLTNSVLLCMLFHSWQNTLVMTIPADTGNNCFFDPMPAQLIDLSDRP